MKPPFLVFCSRREKKRGRGFDEDEQERVYTEAHELKMQARKRIRKQP